MSTREIASLLRAIADVIERNSLTEIEALTTALTQRSGNQRTKKPSDLGKPKYRALPDLSALASRILDAQDREEAKEILEREALTRKELTQLGQAHNVHIVKEDKVELIEAKIVEALVGSRLNSKAIRGEK
jgi:hypothetical protein